MPLFEIAILEVPTKKEQEDGVQEKLLFGPTCTVSKDSQKAAMNALLDNAEIFKGIDRDKLQVIVRPFA